MAMTGYTFTKAFRLLLLTGLLLALAAPCMAASLPDPSGGFGDLAWGQQIAGTPGFTRIKAKGNAEFFVRENDPFSLYGEKMERVIYGARKGKLFATYVNMEDRELYEKLQADLTAKYGQPKRSSSSGVDILKWREGEFEIKLKDYAETGLLKLGFYFEPLADKVDMATLDRVMDTIYSEELEDYWVQGSPMLQQKD